MIGAIAAGVALVTVGAAATVGGEHFLRKGLEEAIDKRKAIDSQEDEEEEEDE